MEKKKTKKTKKTKVEKFDNVEKIERNTFEQFKSDLKIDCANHIFGLKVKLMNKQMNKDISILSLKGLIDQKGLTKQQLNDLHKKSKQEFDKIV